jgi:hypothetical protein
MKNTVKINKEQKVYVIQSENGYSCYGFEVLKNKLNRLAKEYNRVDLSVKRSGTIKAYNNYLKALKIAEKRYKKDGYRSKSELIPEFIGKEGKRVEVLTNYNEKQRFIIGKSTGFIPCHLEIKQRNSSGGGAVCGYPFKSIVFLD